MSALTIAQMEELLAIMARMKQMVSAHEWQELSRLDEERMDLLKRESKESRCADEGGTHSCKSNPEPDHENRKAVLKMQILALDNELLTALQKDRDKLLSENRGLSAQVKAKSVYAQNNSMSF